MPAIISDCANGLFSRLYWTSAPPGVSPHCGHRAVAAVLVAPDSASAGTLQEIVVTAEYRSERLDWAAGLFYYKGFSLNRGHVDLNFLAGFWPPGPPFNGQPLLDFNQNDPANVTDKAAFTQATFKFTDQLQPRRLERRPQFSD